MIRTESEIMHHFDSRRRDFAPYGFTCEIWGPRQMPRPDRHDEIEINFLDRGSLTYLMGGQRVTVQARRVTAFWAAVPHQIIGFNNVNYLLRRHGAVRLGPAMGASRTLADGAHAGPDCCRHEGDTRRPSTARCSSNGTKTSKARCNTNREIVVLELRARLLRLADSCRSSDDSPGASPTEQRHAAADEPGKGRVDGLLCRAQLHVAHPGERHRIAASSLHPDYAATLVSQDVRHDAQRR